MSNKQPTIVVVGSINMDLVAKLDRSPVPGETISGREFAMIPGGKGANQAVAAARLGAKVAMVGCLGGDAFGGSLREQLEREGIDTAHVHTAEGDSTGVALIQVQREGDNSIIVIPGANGRLTPERIDEAEDTIRSADVLLLQLEIPLPAVERAAELAARHGVRVVLNPAPAPAGPLPASLLRHVDVLTPNETEAALLAGGAVRSDLAIGELVRRLKETSGVRHIVVTHGGEGVYYDLDGRTGHQAACRVEPVDTTAAGDCFNAAMAVRWGEGASFEEALGFAARAAAISVTRFGAQPSLPSRAEAEAFRSS